jgi:8-oxo-dGTP diphosphatase
MPRRQVVPAGRGGEEQVMQRVTAAIIEEGGKVFIARRREGKNLAGKWEFPGGKIEPGETPEESLARELAEELDLRVSVGELLCRVFFESGQISLELLTYRVKRLSGEPVLREHDDARWVEPTELGSYDLADSDRRVVDEVFG